MEVQYSILQKYYQILCTSCGVCVAACPTGSLKMGITRDSIFTPGKNELQRCCGCGLCTKVCAGVEKPPADDELCNYGQKDSIIGNWLRIYTGYAIDTEIRRNAASGGVTTAILIGLLEEGSIDGAVVTVPKNDDAFVCKTILARTKDDILRSQKSRYTQVDYSVGLQELAEAKGGRFAVVGLPCHIASITKWSRTSEELKNKIFLKIGLFCGHGVNSELPKFVAQSMRINPIKVRTIDYRSGNWSEFGFKFVGDFGEKWMKFDGTIIGEVWTSYFFCPMRCLICNDGFSEYADISVGDAWNLSASDKIFGTSLVISRTKVGQSTLGWAIKHNKLDLVPVTRTDVIKSQLSIVRVKKKNFSSRIRLWKIFGNPIPVAEDIYNNSRLKLKEAVFGSIVIVITRLSTIFQRVGILQKIPTKLLIIFLKILHRINIYG